MFSTINYIIINLECHQKEDKRHTSTSSSSVTSTPENQLPLVTWSTNAAVSIKELSKNMRRKLLNKEKHLSNMLGLWTNLSQKEKEVSPLIFHSGSLNHLNITSPLLMLLATEISSRTWSLVLLKLIVPFLWLPHLKVNSRLVFLKKDKPENTLFLPSPSVLSKWSFVATRWTKKPSTSLNPDMNKLKKKSLNSWRKSDINPIPSHSSQFPDGTVTTCWKNLPTPHGIKVPSSLKLLIKLSHQKDQLKSHSEFLFKTFTKSVVLEPSQSVELRPVSLNQEWLSGLPHQTSNLKLNL